MLTFAQVPVLPNGTPVPVQTNSECDSILSSLQANDVEEAARMVPLLITGLQQNYRSIRTRPEDLVPSKAEFLGEIHETAAASCGTIRGALAANDPSTAYTTAARLRMVLDRAAAALTRSPQAKFARMEKAVSELSGLPRFYRLDRLAKAALDANDFAKATAYGNELLKTAAEYPTNWDHVNALYAGNCILGLVALHEPQHHRTAVDRVLGRGPSLGGDTKRAGRYLMSAAAALGSPGVMMGPNTLLAKELLERGKSRVVLQYFALCAKYWKADNGKLAEWSAAVKRGEMPDFGPTLSYLFI
jgi:hypothetical protein